MTARDESRLAAVRRLAADPAATAGERAAALAAAARLEAKEAARRGPLIPPEYEQLFLDHLALHVVVPFWTTPGETHTWSTT